MSTRDKLIASLSSDLQAVRPALNVDRLALVWLLLSALYVVGVTHWFGPMRPNALSQLATEPRFLLEILGGTAAIALTAFAAFRALIPGVLGSRLVMVAGGVMAAWLGAYLLGLVSPALEPSMLGKRPHCVWETFLFATPPAIAALFLARRLYPLQPLRSAAALGLASGMLPALYMQLACMYMPEHILKFHIIPGLAVAGFAVLLAWGGCRAGFGIKGPGRQSGS
jgi:hypothetical protein